MPKISVIIPVFNAADSLERCLGSLLAQTFTDWEAICVDDGSTDRSPEILDSHAASDERIKVVHKLNEGVGLARNKAIEKAVGEYFLFVDSDDALHPQTMELCYGMAEKNGADLVCFTYDRKFRTSTIIRHFLHLNARAPKAGKYDISSLDYLLTENIWDYATEYSVKDKWAVKHCQPWRCLYKAGIVRGIDFLPGVIYEDFPWWSEVLLGVKKAVILNLPLYYYYPSFNGYVFSCGQQKKIDSLRRCLEHADKMMEAKAEPEVLEIWKREFRTPFEEKLQKKMKKHA